MIEQAPFASFAIAADAEVDLIALAARLGDRYTLLEAGREQVDEEYLDTFDWGLYHSGRTLARSGRRYRLYSATGFVVCEERGPRKKRPFWWDFPEGRMRDEIKEGAELRALCPQLQLTRDRQSLHLLNEDAKIVAKIWQDLTTVHPEDRAPVELLSLHLSGIRGYVRQFQTVCRLLRQEGRREMAENEHFLAPVFAAADIFPELAGLKFAVTLDRHISVRQGLSEVGLTLLRDIRKNLPGVVGDIDTEFLHDLRIALRRTRSLLSIFAKVIPQAQAERLRDEFKWITQITGSVRDCDVYLLQMDDFRAMLPARLHPGLNGYIQGLREFRKREFKAMKRHLKSSRFDRLLKDWQAFLEDRPEEAAAGDEGLCRDFAAKAMKRRFKKVIRKGSECGPESPDTLLHALRIQTKKLRYLLEFFRSLFPLDEIDQLIRHLKKLQNNLGEFNDLSVQQTMLGTFRSPRRTEDLEQMLAVAAALGGLITHLADRQQQVRGQFEETFAEFAGSENRALLQAIIGSGGQKENIERDGEKP
jgi:CHAD domain-containing protein